ncbi:MAG: sodium:proton antiporter [Proteobacteria bacterium]|nr:sodium:proton antiporter [Pseudomonadota bacterium]MYK30228.1 sodium:proton antiporter [Boseongicola sp. SB0670_bin_30]
MNIDGFACVIPTLVVLVLAVLSKRTIEPLVGGTVVGLAMLAPSELLTNFTDVILTVMQDETIGWVIMVCGLMGGLIAVLARIGGASAFGRLASRRVRTRASALLATWLLGLAVFIDDYLNALAISSSMKRLTDRFRVSREMLAYVVDSTAAPICVLVPLSTWTVFFAAVLEDSAAAETGQGLSVYIGAIPYMFYAWAAVAIVPLVIVGAIPVFGPMRMAEGQVQQPEGSGGLVPGADGSNARHADGIGSQGIDESVPPGTDGMALPGAEGVAAFRAELRGAVLNFLVPILALVGFTWYLGADILKGVTVALALTLVLVAVQRLLSVTELFDTILEGFKSMLLPLGTVVAGFMLKEVNDQLGLAPYVIGVVQPLMTAEFLPLVTFLTIALIAFASGSFWGIIVVAMPIVIPLADAVNADLSLVIGALISASAFGSHTCFYGDSTVLSAHGSGCGAIDHALTQLPYALLAAGVASVAFVVAGFALG